MFVTQKTTRNFYNQSQSNYTTSLDQQMQPVDIYQSQTFLSPQDTYGQFHLQNIKSGKILKEQQKQQDRQILQLEIKSLQFPEREDFIEKYLLHESSQLKFEFWIYDYQNREKLFYQDGSELFTQNLVNFSKNSIDIKYQKFIDLKKLSASIYQKLFILKIYVKKQGQSEFEDYMMTCYQFSQKTTKRPKKLKCVEPYLYDDIFLYMDAHINNQIQAEEQDPTINAIFDIQTLKSQKNVFNPNKQLQTSKSELKLPQISNSQSILLSTSTIQQQQNKSPEKQSRSQSRSLRSSQSQISFQEITTKDLLKKKVNKNDAIFDFNDPYQQNRIQSQQKSISQLAILDAKRQIKKQKENESKIIQDQFLIQCFSIQSQNSIFDKNQKFNLKIQIYGSKGLLKNPVSLESCSITYEMENTKEYENKPYVYVNQQFSTDNFLKLLKEQKKHDMLSTYQLRFTFEVISTNENNNIRPKLYHFYIPLFNSLHNLNVGNYIKNLSTYKSQRKKQFGDNLINNVQYKQVETISDFLIHFSIQYPGQELEKLGNNFEIKQPIIPQKQLQQQQQQKKNQTYILKQDNQHMYKFINNHQNLDKNYNSRQKPLTNSEKDLTLEDDYEEKVIQNIQKKVTNKGTLTVNLIQLQNFDESKGGVAVDYCILNKQGILKDRNNQPIEYENDNIFDGDPSDDVVHLNIQHNIKINPYDLKISHEKDYKDIKILFNLGLDSMEDQDQGDDSMYEEELGWAQFNLFNDRGQFQYGQFSSPVYVPPISQHTKKSLDGVKKTQCTLIFSVKFNK